MRACVVFSAISIVIGLALSSTVACAQAAPTDSRDVSPARARASLLPVPVRLEGSFDIVFAKHAGLAAGICATGLLLLGPIELGVSAADETQIVGYTRASMSGVAGLRLRLSAVELDAAGTLGIALASSSGLFGSDPGVSRVLECAGGRVGVTWFPSIFSNVPTLGLGLIGAYERDFSHDRVPYGYYEAQLMRDVTRTVSLGTQRFEVRAAIVIAFD